MKTFKQNYGMSILGLKTEHMTFTWMFFFMLNIVGMLFMDIDIVGRLVLFGAETVCITVAAWVMDIILWFIMKNFRIKGLE